MPALLERVQYAAMGAALALPTALQRRLAGPPKRVDGVPLALDVQTVLRLQVLSGEPPVETLSIPEGRVVLDHQVRLANPPVPIGEVRSLSVDGAEGPLPARLYVPRRGPWPAPLLVWFHGGGFIYGGLDSHDATCRFLAERAGVRVLAVDYRLAPEHRHPAQRDDCVAAYRWVLEHAEELGADPERTGVGGDSAGGWLAAEVARTAAGSGLACAFQLLVYPLSDARGGTVSRGLFGAGYFLTTRFIDLAEDSWLLPDADRASGDVSLVLTDVPDGLAPAHVVTAGFDPLRDEGESYAARLAAAGVPVTTRRYDDQIHGFVNTLRLASSRAGVDEIAAALRTGLRA